MCLRSQHHTSRTAVPIIDSIARAKNGEEGSKSGKTAWERLCTALEPGLAGGSDDTAVLVVSSSSLWGWPQSTAGDADSPGFFSQSLSCAHTVGFAFLVAVPTAVIFVKTQE